MEHLFVTTYGEPIWEDLPYYNLKQINELGDIIKKIVKDSKQIHMILAPPSQRGRTCAETLASRVGIDYIEPFDYFLFGNFNTLDMSQFHELVLNRGKEIEGEVLITNSEMASKYALYFTKQEFGKIMYDLFPLSVGQAYYLNLSTKEWKQLPSSLLVYKVV